MHPARHIPEESLSVMNRPGELGKPLHVAHFSPAYFSPDSIVGGGERYVLNVVKSLANAPDITQSVISFSAQAHDTVLDGVPVRMLRNESPFPSPMDAFSSQLWTAFSGVDLVHVHQPLTVSGAIATTVAASLGLPIVATDLGGGQHSLMLHGRGVSQVDGLVSISEYAHATIAPFYSGPHVVLIGPLDTKRFAPRKDRQRDRRKVLVVSRLLPHKGIDRVIRSLPKGLSLTIVGQMYDPRYFETLTELARGKAVTFVQDADDAKLLDLYSSCGLFVQASTTRDIYGNFIQKPELMGLTTLEAMSCGLPVLVSDAGSLPELVPNPAFGRVFRNDDELAAQLKDYLKGEWPKENLAGKIRAHVEKHHGNKAIGARFREFYLGIMAARRERQRPVRAARTPKKAAAAPPPRPPAAATGAKRRKAVATS
jgi:glycosyltransferase involved in cell wall biosynthesis